MSSNFESVVDQVNALRQTLVDHQKQLISDTNYNKDGSISRAPHFSKRGHVAESDQSFTFVENYIASMGNPKDIHVATDRVAYNGPKLPVNDQYRDIIVEDLTNKITKSYQSKVCKDAESSMLAATKPKYIEAGVIPLVPKDHNENYSTIGGMVVNGKTITSDPRTLEDLNLITNFYAKGGYIHNFGDDKMRVLHMNAVRSGAAEGAKSAFVHRAIEETINYMLKTNDKPKNILSTCSSMIASTIDGAVRGSLVNDAAFKNNPVFARKLAESSYSIAKDCLKWVIQRKASNGFSFKDNLKMSAIKTGSELMSSIFSTVGHNIGAKFGVLGVGLGSLMGSNIGKAITTTVSAVKFGQAALSALGQSISINGILGGAARQVHNVINVVKATKAAAVGVGAGLVSSIGSFVVAHPILIGLAAISVLGLLLGGGSSPEIYRYYIDVAKQDYMNQINELYLQYTEYLSEEGRKNYCELTSIYESISLKNSLFEKRREAEKVYYEDFEDVQNQISQLERITEDRKKAYQSLANNLKGDNIFSMISESMNLETRHFYGTDDLMRMIK